MSGRNAQGVQGKREVHGKPVMDFPLYTYHISIKDTEKSAFYLVYSFLG